VACGAGADGRAAADGSADAEGGAGMDGGAGETAGGSRTAGAFVAVAAAKAGISAASDAFRTGLRSCARASMRRASVRVRQ